MGLAWYGAALASYGMFSAWYGMVLAWSEINLKWRWKALSGSRMALAWDGCGMALALPVKALVCVFAQTETASA